MIQQFKGTKGKVIERIGILLILIGLFVVGCKTKEKISYARCGGSYDVPKKVRVSLDKLNINKIIQNNNGVPDTLPEITLLSKIPEYIPDSTGMSFESFFKKNFKYPEDARKYEITGRVLILIVVEENGDVSEVRKLLPPSRQLGYGLEEEAVRVVQLITKWKPGYLNDKPVKTTLILPVYCYLED